MRARASNPCGGCTDRTVSPNCHTNCTAYRKWQEEYHKEKRRIEQGRNRLIAEEAGIRKLTDRRWRV